MINTLGIETSCDETSVAIVDEARKIHANIIRSQWQAHAPYGGVVPEIAARAHIEHIEPILDAALREAGCRIKDVDAIAVTAGPGLIGGVIVGVMTAKTLASIYDKPFLGVNHLEGHALTPRLTDDAQFPYLLLLVSGGHCLMAIVRGVGEYDILGGTIDDALGEAFDKCAKMMRLPYPGGPQIERLAKKGDETRFDLPRPLLDREGYDMSFAGLKTAVRYQLREIGEVNLSEQDKADMAASFQLAVGDILVQRTKRALEVHHTDITSVVVAGGVAANQYLAERLREVCAGYDTPFIAPPIQLCTDNGAMIAWAGLERFRMGQRDELTLDPRARWPLGE